MQTFSTSPLHQPSDEHGAGLSRDVWAEWIDEQRRKRAEIYRIKPAEMTGAARREQQRSNDYHGREILELLQNADDAGHTFSGRCKAVLVLTRDGLCIGNTGLPFSPEGVDALLVSDNSPKQRNRIAFIGNKGLGFRAILNWTDEPMILSGELALGFSTCYAAQWLDELCRHDSGVREEVWRRRNANDGQKLLPTLAVPHLLDDEHTLSEREQALLVTAQDLRAQGYDTVVAMPFSRENAYDEAERQIAEQVHPELLLFVNHLVELRVITPNSDRRLSIHRGASVTLFTDQEPPTEWKILRNQGSIPSELLTPEYQVMPGYTVALAIPISGLPQTSGALYSFFPTGIAFPFPLIAHATLILKSDRQDLVPNDANRYVLERLAELLVATVAEMPATTPWQRLASLAPYQHVGSSLQRLGFTTALLKYARTIELLPTLEGQLCKPEEVITLKVGERFLDPSGWLPPRFFGTYALRPTKRPELETAISDLAPPLQSLEIFISSLPNDSYTLEERADVIAGCVRNRLFDGSNRQPPQLLVDDDGTNIEQSLPVFLPPADGPQFCLPDWASISLVNRQLVRMLHERLKVNTFGELRYRLSAYEVSEYRFDEVVRQVARSLEQCVAEHPDERKRYFGEAIHCFFQLLLQSGRAASGENRTEIRIELPHLGGDYAPAKSLYFHQAYQLSQLSVVTGMLYEQVDPTRVVLPASALRIANSTPETIVAFLRWCGVADQPRLVNPGDRMDQFRRFAMQRLTYPVLFKDANEVVDSPDRLLGAQLQEVSSIDVLAAILERANPHTVLAWIELDERLVRWEREGDRNARLAMKFKHNKLVRSMRGQTLPSYVLWRIAYTKWLPANDRRQEPRRCFLSASSSPELAALLPRPSIDPNDPLFKQLNVTPRRVQSALRRAGVSDSIESMTWDDAYQLLLDLPRLDPEGRTARQIYRAVINRPLDELDRDSRARKRFLESGKLLAHTQEGRVYRAPSEMFYKDSSSLPARVYDALPLIELDERRGAGKVEQVFGVTAINPANTKVTVAWHTAHAEADEFSQKLERAKVHIAALRLGERASQTELRRLKAFDIVLCLEAQGSVQLPDGTLRDLDLREQNEQLIDNARALLLVSIDEPTPNLKNDLIADRVGELLAVVLRVDRGDKFTRLLMCGKHQRNQLLANMLGLPINEAADLVARARDLLKIDAEEEAAPERGSYVPPPILHPTNNTQVEPVPPPTPAPSPQSTSNTSEQEPLDDRPTTSTAFVIDQKAHVPAPEQRRRAFVISRTPHGSAAPQSRRPSADPARAEKLVGEFERLAGRYPLPAAHLKGYQAYGCDWLSFASEEDRARFEATQDEVLVLRYIEVKSTVTLSGEVELGGNELAAARRHEDRYYIYRVFDHDEDSIEVYILDDPFEDAHSTTYSVNLLRSSRSERWSMRRGAEQE
jgi:hypothetical protein